MRVYYRVQLEVIRVCVGCVRLCKDVYIEY